MPQGSQGQGQGEQEHDQGGDDEAEDAVVLPHILTPSHAPDHLLRPVLHEDVMQPPRAGMVVYQVMQILGFA